MAKSGHHSGSYENKQQKRKDDEHDAHQRVDSDKSQLDKAMSNLKKVSTGFEYSVKNKTHAESLAGNIAKGVFRNAAADAKGEKEKAASDFNTYMSDLKAATPTEDYSHKVKTVKEQARYLDKLDHKESRDARKRLENKRHAQQKEVRESYRDAHKASRALLHDKNRLANAQRRAG